MTVLWTFPTRILFGEGAVEELGREAKRLDAHHALIVTSEAVAKRGLASLVGQALDMAGVAYSIFDGVTTNPTSSQVDRAAEAYRGAHADLVVAVGGGASIDVAKLLRVRVAQQVAIADLDAGGGERITAPLAHLIAVPTTSGTGSEVSRIAMVTIERDHVRRRIVVSAPALLPNVAVLDPRLTLELPPETTAATGFEALSHCIEAFLSPALHPMADAVALEGIEIVARNLERAVREPRELTARAAMMEAAMMGGVAAQKGLGAAHALAHALATELNLHHGLASALCLPAVLDFNRSAASLKLARVGRILGARGDDVETLAFEASGAVRALRKHVHLAAGLAEVGVTEDALPQLAALATADPVHAGNPRACEEDDMLSLLRASM
jgi:alcohol dehydrogenase class IV